MIETRPALPAALVREVTAAVCNQVQEHDPGDLTRAPRILAAIDQCPERGTELAALIERIDALAPAQRRSFSQAIDEVQVRSKLWLIDELTSRCGVGGAAVWVLGGWYGILPLLINWTLPRPPARMVCIDLDPHACALGQQVIGALYPNIEYRLADVMDLDYPALAAEPSSVLINTICEHLPDIRTWWDRVPAGQLSVLQSNNYAACPDHVNSVPDLAAMKAQTPLAGLLYEGVLELPIMNRFMLIGYR